MPEQTVIEIKNLSTYLGGAWVNKDLNLEIQKGEVLGIVGGSGSGKTTLLREILYLQKPHSGSIQIFGKELATTSATHLLALQKRWGVLFQQNALFSSLTVLDNVAFPLKEHTDLDKRTIKDLALLKLLMAGLPTEAALKYPAELSGGMQKRAALARAIVLDPELLFLDEPTTGLDPNSASGIDDLILNFQATMGLTIVLITHDLDTLWRVTNRVAFLAEGKVLCVAAMAQLVNNPHPLIQQFFNGPRGRVVRQLISKEDRK
ncbi:MAG TPA: ATP-binding cassette domain-containing protein [Gammaproteobacteria bacterium]|nr:ATP-binding cassette domain-containing protein [Gammaproteobacteria bacterium]